MKVRLKNFKETFITLLVVGVVALFGCTQNTTQLGVPAPAPLPSPGGVCSGSLACNGSATPAATAIPTGPGGNVSNPAVPTPTPLTTGATGLLTITNQNAFNSYVGTALNNPSNIQINLKLSPTSDSPQVFLGNIHIRYNDSQPSGQLILHDGTFTNGTTPQYGNNVHTLTTDASTGASTYRIMAEDRGGALVVLLTPNSGGGADTGQTVNGQLYFYNFNSQAPNPLFDDYYEQTAYCAYGYDPNCIYYGNYYYNHYPANPRAFCWAGEGNGPTIGPYDCRNSATPPTSGSKVFTLLGTVSNIDIHNALGI
jgi:hypothetical protein